MRILHTIAFYPPDTGGGATEVVRQISERLAARGHDITVATAYSARRTSFEVNAVKIKQFRIYGRLGQSVMGIRGEIEAFQSELLLGRYDVIMNYAAQTWHTDLTCRIIERIRSTRVLCACGYSGLVGWRRIIYWRYFQRLPAYLKRYDAVVHHSDIYQDASYGREHQLRNTVVIPNGVDSLAFQASDAATEFRRKYNVRTKYLAISVGDHYKNKGHHSVIDAFERLHRADVTLAIVGRNSARWPRSCWQDCCRSSRKATGRLLLLNDIPRSDVASAFCAADLFLSASRIEAFPLVILEAMASSTPYIAFRAGNIAELNGGLIVNNVREMAREMSRLLDCPSERVRLAELGREQQGRMFEWAAVVDQYEQLYSRLVHLNGGSR